MSSRNMISMKVRDEYKMSSTRMCPDIRVMTVSFVSRSSRTFLQIFLCFSKPWSDLRQAVELRASAPSSTPSLSTSLGLTDFAL